MTNVVSWERVTEILRESRKLMNNNGRHWIQGSEEEEIVDIVIGSDGWEIEKPTGEFGYCSIGAIRKLSKNEEEVEAAAWELAKVITPGLEEDVKLSWQDEWEEIRRDDCQKPNCASKHDNWAYCDCDYTAPNPTQRELMKHHMDNDLMPLEDIITENNDDSGTTWKDVSAWFTKASKRVSQRKV